MRRLKAMVRDGQLYIRINHTYSTDPIEDKVEGVVKLNEQRQGVLLVSGGDISVQIGFAQMKGLFVGDKISANLRPSKYPGSYKVSSYKVISRALTECDGQYVLAEGGDIGYVIPAGVYANQQILIMPKDSKKANNHDSVRVEISVYPTEKTPAIGKVKEVLPPKALVDILVDQFSIDFAKPSPWKDSVLKDVAKQQLMANKWRWAKKCLTDDSIRKDLRELPFMTIDGADAKDFDDAIYCDVDKDGSWDLYVAIADVSHFIEHQSELDAQAQIRATSIYFPTRVIPMLPEGLSNDLCSLVPGKDRLTLVCQMKVNSDGKLEGSEFYPAIINSHARLTYNEAWKYLSLNKKHKNKKVDDSLRHAYALHVSVTEDRRVSGSLVLELPEEELKLNQFGEIEKVDSLERNGAHVMIESCMLLANISAARFLDKHQIPGIYRVHEETKDEKKTDLIAFLRHQGFKVPRKLTVKHISEILLKARSRADFSVIQLFVLRSMMQAVYHTKNKGHFGLGFSEYTHFTSPIRRYPDLIVHRLIKSHLYGKKSPYKTIAELSDIAGYASQQERTADDYSRKVTNALKCHYLKH